MKTVVNARRAHLSSYNNESEEVRDLLIDNNNRGHDCNGTIIASNNVLNNMGHKGRYQRVVVKNNVTQDSRSQSLPNCLIDEKNKLQDTAVDTVDFCDNEAKLPCAEGLPWFKTWPERCDKLNKSSDSSLQETGDSSLNNTQTTSETRNCDIVENGTVNKNKLTLSEALQNISLAYSPVTKQLHLLDKSNVEQKSNDVHLRVDNNDSNKRKGHKRNEPGSFSSTISTLSDPSTSGSLLDADERSLSSIDESNDRTRKKSLTDFFSRFLQHFSLSI